MEKIGRALEKANELKIRELLCRKEQEEEKKKDSAIVWIFAIIGVIVAAVAIGYVVYRYLNPDYLEDFDEDFGEEFEDEEEDFFEDEGEN